MKENESRQYPQENNKKEAKISPSPPNLPNKAKKRETSILFGKVVYCVQASGS